MWPTERTSYTFLHIRLTWIKMSWKGEKQKEKKKECNCDFHMGRCDKLWKNELGGRGERSKVSETQRRAWTPCYVKLPCWRNLWNRGKMRRHFLTSPFIQKRTHLRILSHLFRMALWIISSFYMMWWNIESKHSSVPAAEETLMMIIATYWFFSAWKVFFFYLVLFFPIYSKI